MSTEDHLPPPRSKEARKSESLKPKEASSRSRGAGWGDRILFGLGGLLLGFTVAYVYLEKVPQPAQEAASDPHAGIPGVGPGATRDLPDGGSAPQSAVDPGAEHAVKELEAAVAKTPNDYELLVKLGNAAYDAQDAGKAVQAYERALAIKSDDANVLTDLGVSYRNLGQLDKALAAFDKALAVKPDHWPALFNQVIVYGVDKKDLPRAKTLLARLRKEHPEVPALDKLEKALDGKAPGG